MKKLLAALMAAAMMCSVALADTTIYVDTSDPDHVRAYVLDNTFPGPDVDVSLPKADIDISGPKVDIAEPILILEDTPEDRDRDEQEFYPDKPTTPVPLIVFRDRNPSTGR
jgi:hypothetical protein